MRGSRLLRLLVVVSCAASATVWVQALAAAPAAAATTVPRPDHIVIVVEENRGFGTVLGSANAPYINSLAASGADFTQSFGETHPSQPNYLALFSGSTQGLTDDSCPHTYTGGNLGSQLIASGFGFTGYSESLPSVGYTGCGSGKYARKHAPWVNFSNLAASTNQPFTAFPTDYSTLPDVSFVIPNLDNDMHDGTVAQGDQWLQSNLGGYITWAQTHNSVFVLTFDEDEGTTPNQIPTIITGQGVVPGSYAERINHYNVLRTIEDAYGLAPLGAAASAAPILDIWSPPSGTGSTVAADGFGRSVSAGWGTADVGGVWSRVGSSSLFSVASGVGLIRGPTAGSGPTALLGSVSVADLDLSLDVAADKPATGGGDTVVLMARHSGSSDYRLKLRLLSGGVVHLAWSVVVSGRERTLREVNVAGLTYSPGQMLRMRFDVSGAGAGVTSVSGSVWPAGSAEPAVPLISGTDSEPSVQGAGSIGIQAGLASTVTNAPVTFSFDNLAVTDTSGGGEPPANQPPTAAFVSSCTALACSFDASGSSDPDGSIASYAWDFGDGATGPGATPTHAYATAGTNQVTLTVTDDDGATGTVTHAVTVSGPANEPPTAAFVSSCTALACSFDASGSSDPDGSIASYAWDFGDGATGSGATPTHAYATAGTNQVTLTVTDDDGATGTVTHAVSVSAPSGSTVAADGFGRSVSAGWGTADVGGVWSRVGSSSAFSVASGAGLIRVPTAGSGPTALLGSVSAADVDLLVDLSVDKVATGGGETVVLMARRSGSSDYRLKVRFLTGGVVHLAWSRVVAGAERTLGEVLVRGMTYSPGQVLRVRFDVNGAGAGVTSVSGSVWLVGSTEPASPVISGTDSEPTLQGAGSIGIQAGLASTVTNAPVTFSFDNLAVTDTSGAV